MLNWFTNPGGENPRFPTSPLFNDLLILLATLIIIVEIYRKLRQICLRHLLSQKKKAKRARKPPVLPPRSERNCHFCQEDKGKRKAAEGEVLETLSLRKGKGRTKKKMATLGYFCPNQSCEYYGISDEWTRTLAVYGKHGMHEMIRDFKCQACGKQFKARLNTVMYWLKSHLGIAKRSRGSWL